MLSRFSSSIITRIIRISNPIYIYPTNNLLSLLLPPKAMYRGNNTSTTNTNTNTNTNIIPFSYSSALSQPSSSGGRGWGHLEMEGNSRGSRGRRRGAAASGPLDTIDAHGRLQGNINTHMPTSSFSTFAESSSSGGRGRGHLDTDGSNRGSRGRGRGPGVSGPSRRIDALDRLLTRILRHKAAELSLDMRSDGYVRVRDLLKLDMKSRANIPLSSHSINEIREAVRTDNKQRLGLLEENGELFIRANQGHSVNIVESESLLKPITSADEITVCVHGTYREFLEPILQSGLKRMSRLHVHFACGLPSDHKVTSGMRHDINMLIFLDVKKALEDGMKLYLSDNKVILSEGFDGVVPAKYFQKIEMWPSRKPVPLRN